MQRFSTSMAGAIRSLSLAESFDLSTNWYGISSMLLAGYALENVVKGLLVARSAQRDPTEFVLGSIKSHQLPGLFKRAGIPLNESDQQMLKQLADTLLWKGRYCTPLDRTKVKGPLATYGRLVCHPAHITTLFLKVLGAYPQPGESCGQAAQYRELSPQRIAEFLRHECPGWTEYGTDP